MTAQTVDMAKVTPMMRQYYDLKAQAGDAILFFRMGDFFEIFGDDAEHIAPILEIVLTSRERGDQKKIPFCGVPHHAARNYYLRLLKKGYKIAIADQVEDPAEAKGLVKREIVRTLTPGCIDDLDGLEQDLPNYLMGIYEDPQARTWTLALCDLSTGELRLGEADTLSAAREWIGRFRPRELLARRFQHAELKPVVQDLMLDSGMILQELPEAALQDSKLQLKIVQDVLGNTSLDEQPCGPVTGGMALLGAVLSYVQSQQAGLQQFLAVRPLRESGTMSLSETAMRDLELFETVRRRQTEGSLLREINATLSPMGARFLRYSLANPLLNQEQICARHDAVAQLLELGEPKLKALRERLRHTPDLERLATRIFAGSASPAELQKARVTLSGAAWLVEDVLGRHGNNLRTGIFTRIALALEQAKEPLALLQAAIGDEPTALGKGNGVFRAGYNAELDRLATLARGGEEEIAAYQQKLREQSGINSLKIKGHKTFGLLIEVTKSNLGKVPAEFIRRQTMVNNERFVTEELVQLDQKLASASELVVTHEQALYGQLLLALGRHRDVLQSVCQAFASFDLLQSFAWTALTKSYIRPEIASNGRLQLLGARHPVVERFVGKHDFTPNDLELSAEAKHAVITGPNMAGKSTVMRQTALCAILNQMGAFVPAASATLPIFDQIFTRVGAADDLSRGQSTFMVEMSEAALILRQATAQSLVILDEVGRGTSTQDGLAIATAILEQLAVEIDCYSLFATHYHELVPMAHSLANVRVVQTEVLEQGDEIIFTHRLIAGASGSSFGIEVARLAGLPTTVLEKARQHLAGQQRKPELAHPDNAGVAPRQVQGASSFATSPVQREWLERLARINLNRMTPIQALNVIAEFQAAQHSPLQMSLFGGDAQEERQES